MSGRLPRATGPAVIRALERGGWIRIRTTGGHAHLKHPDRSGLVTVGTHAGEIIPPGTMKSILRQSGLTANELKDLL